jgi:hypothetical protein
MKSKLRIVAFLLGMALAASQSHADSAPCIVKAPHAKVCLIGPLHVLIKGAVTVEVLLQPDGTLQLSVGAGSQIGVGGAAGSPE